MSASDRGLVAFSVLHPLRNPQARAALAVSSCFACAGPARSRNLSLRRPQNWMHATEFLCQKPLFKVAKRGYSVCSLLESDSIQDQSISSKTTPTVKDGSIWNSLLFGFDPSPELIAILSVYFIQGVLGISRLAVSFFLKDDLHLDPATVAAMTGLATLPWLVKPVYGFLSDGLPLFGYRRRSYLVLSGLLGTAAWISLGTVVNDASSAILATIVASLSVAISDVIADSVVVERARCENQSRAGSLQSLCWASAAVGGLVSAYASGSLLEAFSTRTVFLITAVFPLVVAGVAALLAEQRLPPTPLSSRWEPIAEQVGLLKEAITTKSIWLPTLFIFLWQATPTADSAFFFFATNDLHFSAEFLGRVRFVTSAAALFGVWLYQRYLKQVPIKDMFLWSTLLSVPLGMTNLILVTHANRLFGLSDQWFSIGDSLVLTVLGQVAFMPLLVLAARLCPPGVEATLFALLMSITNAAGALSTELGALLTKLLGVTESNFENLALLLFITNMSSLLPLPFLKWLPDTTEARDSVLPLPSDPVDLP